MQAIARHPMASSYVDRGMQSSPEPPPGPSPRIQQQRHTEQSQQSPLHDSSLDHAALAPSPCPRPLEHLPNELIEPIAAYLVPQRLFTSRFDLRRSGRWETLDASVQWACWKLQHNELLALVQTSRRLAAIATPYLYYRLVIHDARSLVALFRLLGEKPEIGGWISDISCVANLVKGQTVAQVRSELRRQFQASRPRDTVDVASNTIALDIFCSILHDASRLRNLLVAFPDQTSVFGPPDEIDMTSLVIDYVMTAHTSNALTHPITRYFPDMAILSRLTSLRLYCHREYGQRGDTYDRAFADYIIARLPELRNLKTLELCCASSASWLPDEVELPSLPTLQRLCFFGSNIHEPSLVRLVSACVNLVTLLVHFEQPCDDLVDRPQLPGGKTLNDALLGVAPTLVNLEIVTLTDGHYLTRGPERPRRKENHRLTCLPELTKLECLTVDYRGLFGTLGLFEHDDGERLLRLLPPSLWCFTLICEWGTEADFRQIYLANLDMILYGVQCLCSATVPRVRSLSLAIHSWPAESKFRARFRRQIAEAAAGCAKAGTKFRTHDLLPSYRDEDEDEDEDEGEVDGEEGADKEVDHDAEGGENQEDEILAGLLALQEEEELELEEEDEASEYYFSGDEESDPEREARRPASFDDFVQRLGENHGHSFDELYYAWHEDRWDEYLF